MDEKRDKKTRPADVRPERGDPLLTRTEEGYLEVDEDDVPLSDAAGEGHKDA